MSLNIETPFDIRGFKEQFPNIEIHKNNPNKFIYTMKLKYININGYGVLVDESAEIKENDYFINPIEEGYQIVSKAEKYNYNQLCNKIIFAEKELNIDVPVLTNWRDWEVEELAKKHYPNNWNKANDFEDPLLIISCSRAAFIKGYNHNKAKYTEEDLRKVIEMTKNSMGVDNCGEVCYSNKSNEQIIQSLQKIPEYIVMESEEVMVNYKDRSFGDAESLNPNGERSFYYDKQPKLITNSEAKQEGIIKEIIY